MIVCYVQGGGLGHLTRIRAYLHTVHPGEPATILTGSPFAADPRVLGPHRLLPAAALPDLRPSTLVVDAFPAGIDGELDATRVPSGTRTVHLARLLRWDGYHRLLPPHPIHFDRTWTVEDLDARHLAHLAGTSAVTAPLQLTDPPAGPMPQLPAGAWLIAHAGPPAEIRELLAYAGECAAAEGRTPPLVLASPHRPAGLPQEVEHLGVYPVWPLFEQAGRVFTAAGFNAVRQLSRWRGKHRMLPFPRRWDDQFTRAARARAEHAAR